MFVPDMPGFMRGMRIAVAGGCACRQPQVFRIFLIAFQECQPHLGRGEEVDERLPLNAIYSKTVSDLPVCILHEWHQLVDHPGLYDPPSGYGIDQSCSGLRWGMGPGLVDHDMCDPGLLQVPAEPGAADALSYDEYGCLHSFFG